MLLFAATSANSLSRIAADLVKAGHAVLLHCGCQDNCKLSNSTQPFARRRSVTDDCLHAHGRRIQASIDEGTMKPAAHVCASADTLKDIDNPSLAFVVDRRSRVRAHKTPVRLMKYDNTAGSHEVSKPAQHFCSVCLEQKHIATNDSIERPVERHPDRVAFAKRDIEETAIGRNGRCRGDCGRRQIGAHDFSRAANKVGGNKGHRAGSATNIEHPHARDYACSQEIVPCHMTDKTFLASQTSELKLGMAQYIGRLRHDRNPLCNR